MSEADRAGVRVFHENFGWDQVSVLEYKEDGSAPFRAVTRQVLFKSDGLACELRYFEVAPGGFSTLERHHHVHAVLILRGRGSCLLGDEVREVAPHDLVTVPSWTWHQFRAAASEPLGFLCMVNASRDRPQLPDEAELQALQRTAALKTFLNPVPCRQAQAVLTAAVLKPCSRADRGPRGPEKNTPTAQEAGFPEGKTCLTTIHQANFPKGNWPDLFLAVTRPSSPRAARPK